MTTPGAVATATTCPSWCSTDVGHPYTHIHAAGVAEDVHVHVTAATVPSVDGTPRVWVAHTRADDELSLELDGQGAAAAAELLGQLGHASLADLIRKAAGIARGEA
jgi:hypothetical protein